MNEVNLQNQVNDVLSVATVRIVFIDGPIRELTGCVMKDRVNKDEERTV